MYLRWARHVEMEAGRSVHPDIFASPPFFIRVCCGKSAVENYPNHKTLRAILLLIVDSSEIYSRGFVPTCMIGIKETKEAQA
jgi:hypothetical protein